MGRPDGYGVSCGVNFLVVDLVYAIPQVAPDYMEVVP